MVVIRRARESSIETVTCRRALTELGLRSLKLTPRGQRGWADRMFFLPVAPAFIEFKREGDAPRALQEERARVMGELRYDVLLGVDDVEVAVGWLRKLVEARGWKEYWRRKKLETQPR